MDALIFKTLREISAEQDEAKKAQMKADSNAELAVHFKAHPSDLEELGFELLNIAWSDAMQSDIVPQLIEVKSIGLGDVDWVDEDLRGQRAYWQGKGGQILSDVIRYERAFMPREELVTALDFHQDEIALDFWGTFDRNVNQAQEKLRQLPAQRLVELVRASITAATNGGIYYGTFAANTLTAAQMDSVIDQVAARSGGQLSIVGTRIAVRYFSLIGMQFGFNVQERIFETGQVGLYKGYPVVQIENFQDFAGNFVLPNNELWLVGRNAGRLTFYGDTAKVQQLRLPSFYTRWETARDAGMLLYGAHRGRIGRVVLT